MSILNNAIVSIQLGMEDFHSDDPRRVQSAIRNLYAGILLLFKYKLQQLSPEGSDEVLLKTKIIPTINPTTGIVAWVGKGKKTVEVHDITERLTALGITNIEWNRLSTLQSIRNNIEHYFSTLPAERMKEAVANSLHLIIQFCEPYLGQQPVDILGQECWELMLNEATIYDAELQSCRDNLESVNWPFPEVGESIPKMRCPECDSELLRVTNTQAIREDINFLCSSCQEEFTYPQIVGPAISEAMAGKNHWRAKYGDQAVTGDCPECGEDTFLLDHNECASCLYELEYTECEWCGESLGLEDQYLEGTCGYCQNRYDRIMAE